MYGSKLLLIFPALLLPLQAFLAQASTLAQEPASTPWPTPAQCQALLDQQPGQTMAELLSAQADLATMDIEEAKLRELVSSLRQKNRFQEMIWLLDEAQLPIHLPLSQALACYFLLGKIKGDAPLDGGSTLSRHIYLSDLDLEGVFKPEQGNCSASIGSEVGAYRFDRLLHLNSVPLTIARRFSSSAPLGSLQYFVKESIPVNKLSSVMQHKTAEMLVLDYFGKNIDRDPKNYLFYPMLGRYIAIDNGWGLRGNNIFARIKAFFVDKRTEAEKRWEFPAGMIPHADLIHRIENLTAADIEAALKGVVGKTARQKLYDRKPKILRSLGR